MAAGPKITPASLASAASCSSVAIPSSALDGMHPTWRHSPPSALRVSTSTVSRPRSAARKAAAYPPGPPPSTTRSASRGSSPMTTGAPSLPLEEEALGSLEEGDEIAGEACRLHPVDDAMVEGERQRQDKPRDDLAVSDDRRLTRAANPE